MLNPFCKMLHQNYGSPPSCFVTTCQACWSIWDKQNCTKIKLFLKRKTYFFPNITIELQVMLLKCCSVEHCSCLSKILARNNHQVFILCVNSMFEEAVKILLYILKMFLNVCFIWHLINYCLSPGITNILIAVDIIKYKAVLFFPGGTILLCKQLFLFMKSHSRCEKPLQDAWGTGDANVSIVFYWSSYISQHCINSLRLNLLLVLQTEQALWDFPPYFWHVQHIFTHSFSLPVSFASLPFLLPKLHHAMY